MHESFLRIYAVIAAIPEGRVMSYGAVARRAGLPGRARMVGRALRMTPEGMKLPWHRVLRADGRIALPAAGAGFDEQCRRLLAEGIRVRNGRVAMSAFCPEPDADRLLWGPPDTESRR